MRLLFSIIAASFFLVGCNEKFDKNQTSANLIIDALDGYKQDHGFLPEKLKDLVPTYLEEIPKSSYDDREFIYEKSGDVYELTYLGAFGVEATYHSSSKEWTYDD